MMEGGGIFDSAGRFIPRSNLHEALDNIPLYPTNEVDYQDEVVIYIGDLYSCFGHSLIDNLKKIWFLKTSTGKKMLEDGAKIVYLSFYGECLAQHVNRIFELAGFNLAQAARVDRPTKFKKIVIPDDSIFIANNRRYYTDEFKLCIVNIILKSYQRVKQPVYDKIYLSRTWLEDKEDFGEKRIEKLFEQKGRKIIHPETMSIEEQVCSINQCHYIVATLGSISHLSLFAPPPIANWLYC